MAKSIRPEIIAVKEAPVAVNAEMRVSAEELADLVLVPLNIRYEDQIREELAEVKRLSLELSKTQNLFDEEIAKLDDPAVESLRAGALQVIEAALAASSGVLVGTVRKTFHLVGDDNAPKVNVRLERHDLDGRARRVRFEHGADLKVDGGVGGSTCVAFEHTALLPYTDEQRRLADSMEELGEALAKARSNAEETKKEHVAAVKRHNELVRYQYAKAVVESNADFNSLKDAIYGDAYVANLKSVAKRFKGFGDIEVLNNKQLEGK